MGSNEAGGYSTVCFAEETGGEWLVGSAVFRAKELEGRTGEKKMEKCLMGEMNMGVDGI